MSNVVRLHTPNDVGRLWEEYAALIRAANADRRLFEDRAHMEAAARAHSRWSKAFTAVEGAQ
jgi:hypothetical protein